MAAALTGPLAVRSGTPLSGRVAVNFTARRPVYARGDQIMMRTRTAQLLRFVTIATVVVPLAACELATASFRAEAKEAWNRTFTLPATGTLEVENTNGGIKVEPATGSEVEVRAERIAKSHSEEAAKDLLKQVEIVVEQSGDRVRLKSKFPKSLHMSSVEIRYTVKVPPSLSVKLENTNGKVSVTEVANTVDASTTNGGVGARGSAAREGVDDQRRTRRRRRRGARRTASSCRPPTAASSCSCRVRRRRTCPRVA